MPRESAQCPLDKDILWSANNKHRNARMPLGEERISCSWKSGRIVGRNTMGKMHVWKA